MGAISSQITSFTIVYSTVYPGTDQRYYKSSASLAVGEFPAQRAVTPKMFPFDDVIVVLPVTFIQVILPSLGFDYLTTYISIKMYFDTDLVFVYIAAVCFQQYRWGLLSISIIFYSRFFCIKQTFNMNSLLCLHNSFYWCNACVFARLLSFSCIAITCILLRGICTIVSTNRINLSREISILDCVWNSWRANQSSALILTHFYISKPHNLAPDFPFLWSLARGPQCCCWEQYQTSKQSKISKLQASRIAIF